MAQQVQIYLSSNFYDQMNFYGDQHLAVKKAINELIDLLVD